MDILNLLFICYGILGLIFILFSKRITHFIYSLALYFTNKLNIDQVFIFKIDNSNRNSMFFLTRSTTIIVGILILGRSLSYIW